MGNWRALQNQPNLSPQLFHVDFRALGVGAVPSKIVAEAVFLLVESVPKMLRNAMNLKPFCLILMIYKMLDNMN